MFFYNDNINKAWIINSLLLFSTIIISICVLVYDWYYRNCANFSILLLITLTLSYILIFLICTMEIIGIKIYRMRKTHSNKETNWKKKMKKIMENKNGFNR